MNRRTLLGRLAAVVGMAALAPKVAEAQAFDTMPQTHAHFEGDGCPPAVDRSAFGMAEPYGWTGPVYVRDQHGNVSEEWGFVDPRPAPRMEAIRKVGESASATWDSTEFTQTQPTLPISREVWPGSEQDLT